ncbi:hypothetical protein MHYP_G00065200 [Metynnis hypsauchen]
MNDNVGNRSIWRKFHAVQGRAAAPLFLAALCLIPLRERQREAPLTHTLRHTGFRRTDHVPISTFPKEAGSPRGHAPRPHYALKVQPVIPVNP